MANVDLEFGSILVKTIVILLLKSISFLNVRDETLTLKKHFRTPNPLKWKYGSSKLNV